MKAAVFLLGFGLIIVALLQEFHPQQRLADSVVFDFNEEFTSYSADTLRLMGFGYSRAIGAMVWLRFLEQTPPRKVEKNQVSWIFLDLYAVSELDPEFYPIYEHGGIFLSVITEDKRGAEQIMLRGTKEFPDRWRIRAYLGYHYQFELLEPEKAAEQYKVGALLPGAPPLIGVLASSLIQSHEGTDQSMRFLEGMIREAKDPEMRRRFEEKLQKIRKGVGKNGK